MFSIFAHDVFCGGFKGEAVLIKKKKIKKLV